MIARKWKWTLCTLLGLAGSSGYAADVTPLVEPNAMPSATAPLTLPNTSALGGAPGTTLTTHPDLNGECCIPSASCDCLCGPPGKYWVSSEWLFWTASGQPLPALITTAPPGAPRATAGTLGDPNTQVLFGNQRVNDDFRNGYRLRAGMWLNDEQTFGIEGNFFFLGRSRQGGVAGANGSVGSPIITRPFNNAVTGQQDAELVSFPGVLAGTVSADATSDVIGGGFNFLCNICCNPCGRFDLITGFRYMNLRDQVSITENLTALPGSGVTPGTNIIVQDRFNTNNDFYGGLIGGYYERRFGSMFVGVRSSIALGLSHQEIGINGSTTFIPPGQTFPGGLLTQNSNIGSYTNDEFAVMPEVGVRFGAQITPRFRGFVGYDWLYWSTVSRAGDQIDLNLNPNQLPPAQQPYAGPAFPAVRTNVTDFWLQGISIGGEFRF